MNTITRFVVPLLFIIGGVIGFAVVAQADHSWGNAAGDPYHWARTSNPFTIKMGDNLTSSWDPYLATAAADWSTSAVLDVSVVASGRNH